MKKIKLTYGHDNLAVMEVLHLPVFERCEVLGGNKGLQNRCNHMTILETPEGLNWMEGGEFLLTAGYALCNKEEDKRDMILNAYNKGVSAIGIKENRYFGEIDDKLIEDADRYGIPLIKLPYDLVYTDTISSFYDLLFYRKNEYILNLNNIYEKLLNLSFENKDIDGIIYSLSNLSNSNVFLFDDTFSILGHSIIDSTSYKDIASYLPFNNMGKPLVKDTKASCLNYKVNNSYISIYPIIRNNKDDAFLYLITKERLGAAEQSSIEYGTSIIAMNLEREWMIKLSQTRFNKILVETMLNNKDLPDEFYNNVEKDLGWDKEGKFIGICIKIDTKDDGSLIDFNHIIYEILNDVLGSNDYLTTDRSNEIFLFLKMQSNIYFKDMINEIRESTKIYREKFLASIGISNTYNSLKEIEKLYNEAYLAALFCENNVTYYKSLNTMKLLYPLKEDDEIRSYYGDTIERLEIYDKSYGANLLETIEAYFRYNLNKKVTASKLFIHVETLRYRLNRIEEITGYSVNDTEGIFALQMGLKLKKILKLK